MYVCMYVWLYVCMYGSMVVYMYVCCVCIDTIRWRKRLTNAVALPGADQQATIVDAVRSCHLRSRNLIQNLNLRMTYNLKQYQ